MYKTVLFDQRLVGWSNAITVTDSEFREPGIDQLKPQSPWTHCEMSGDIGVKITKEDERQFLSVLFSWVLTVRAIRRLTGSQSPGWIEYQPGSTSCYKIQPVQRRRFQRLPEHVPLGFPGINSSLGFPDITPCQTAIVGLFKTFTTEHEQITTEMCCCIPVFTIVMSEFKLRTVRGT